jgi:UDP-N-acetylmuramoylalanine--D-glutamate ligase
MERLGESSGVLFINDSKATNPASTAPGARAAYPRVHWICGGLPKGDDLDDARPRSAHVAAPTRSARPARASPRSSSR